jgi:integrase
MVQFCPAVNRKSHIEAGTNRDAFLLIKGYAGLDSPKVNRIPAFPRLVEDNIRKGFLEDEQYEKVFVSCSETWFRAIVEGGRTYGWRVGELLNMRVKQIDLLARTIRLEPGTSEPEKIIRPNLTPSDNRMNRKILAMVPGGGVEPPRPEGRRILSPLRLPVPPSRLYFQVHDSTTSLWLCSLFVQNDKCATV